MKWYGKKVWLVVSLFIMVVLGTFLFLKDGSLKETTLELELVPTKNDSIMDNVNINFSKEEELGEGYRVRKDNGNVIMEYKNYSVSLQPKFILSNGNILTWAQIPSNVQKDIFVTKQNYRKYKYGVTFSNVTTTQKNLLSQVLLEIVDLQNLQLSDVEVSNGKIIVKNKITFSHDDILRTYDIDTLNRTGVYIGGLDNSWLVCPTLNCSQGNYTQTNWVDNGDGTWNITFDPQVTLTPSSVTSYATLTNTRAEPDFVHLSPTSNTTMLYLPFDYNFTSNGIVYDYTAQDNDGTVSGTVTYQGSSIRGGGVYFDGSSDIITVPDDDSLYAPNEITVALWFKTTDNDGAIMDKQDAASSGYRVIVESGGLLEWGIFGGADGCGYEEINSPSTINDGAWHFFAGRWNASSTVTNMYLDGSVVASSNQNCIANSPLDLVFGEQDASTGWQGYLDDVWIFNKTLTDSEVDSLYADGYQRLFGTGAVLLENQTAFDLDNVTTANNRVNVTATFLSYNDSKVNLSVGYSSGGSFTYTTPQTLTSGTISTFTIGTSTTNLTFNFTQIAGGNNTFSPIMYNNITYEAFTEGGGGDSCTYSSGNWAITCSDNCMINSSTDLLGNNLSLTGSGTVIINGANLTGIDKLNKASSCTLVKNGGLIAIT